MAYSQCSLILFLVCNSIVHLTAQQYTSIPAPEVTRAVPLKHSFQLRCLYNGEGDGEFMEWFKEVDGESISVNLDKPGHYIVKHSKSESSLTIKIFVNADAEVSRWYVSSEGFPSACQFGPITLIPSPQGIEDNKGRLFETAHESIRRSEDQMLTLKCLIEPNNTNTDDRLNWQFSSDDKAYGLLPDGINRNGPVLTFPSVQKAYRGFYRCKLDDVSFKVLLRVKDRLAALWPFIGIVSVVAVLVIVILIFEKRQKSNKKTVTTDDDDQDHASDPLVRTTTKASDNDSKKRAVKA